MGMDLNTECQDDAQAAQIKISFVDETCILVCADSHVFKAKIEKGE